VIEKVLVEIGAGEIPAVLVPNKVDLVSSVALKQLKSANVSDVCPISALTGAGLPELLETVGLILDRKKEQFHACFTPAQSGLVALLRDRGRIVKERYDGDLLRITAMVAPKLAGQVRKLLDINGVQAEWKL
jgi:GTP-binding protein HflX